ncbi:hypothetical protein [uncultured Microbacterium sp.]|uniref:hypothetical protein n=1 Tax=uncultured Microbacterium sp. TaxID=191216 RepID=UPI0028DBA8D6|nr:hypothetical protein [uncultured Microbacterium sp.]
MTGSQGRARAARRMLLAAVALLAAATTSSCNLNWEIRGPYAVGVDDGRLLLAVCESVTIESIRVFEALRNSDRTASRLVWEADGPGSISAGRVLVVSDENDGFHSHVLRTPSPTSEVRYLRIRVNDNSDPTLAGSVYIPDGGLVEGEWATPSGETREQPCGASETVDAAGA